MKKVKLCGMFRDIDIEYANACMPDFVGFVFAPSRREISMDEAGEFRKKLNPNIQAVGVFVNEEPFKILEGVSRGIFQMIQLHGDEDQEYIRKLKEKTQTKIIQAIQVRSQTDIELAEKSQADFLLLDAWSKEARGGTGESFSWEVIPKLSKPFFLAGGLNLNNIREAMKYKAFAYDLSSGIETEGRKDFEKMKKIVEVIKSNHHPQ